MKGDTPEIAAEALKTGRLVMLPTETVYGLAADASNPQAVARIFEAKGRPRFNPLIAHVANALDAEAVAVFDERARALAEAFWPGPLTIVAPARDRERVCDLARAGLDSVAVRVPGHPRARAVIAAFGGAVVAPSANRSGRPSPTTFDDALEETGHAVGAAVDGGPCAVGVESTVVSVLDGRVALLRPGSVTREEIEAVVGPLAEEGGQGHRSPGRLALHYAPDAPVRIEAEAAKDGEILLGFGPGVGDPRWSLSPAGDLREAAANLFRLLREADRAKPAGIAVSPIPHKGLGEAINDRLRRAAGFVG
ncbi:MULTISPECIES: L-threonylcarbamoyladenylate synthase [unclassified Brevundimonas]|uniref:L-threonylcarbamoyladenylate synthase n=1 Tax=unclassified Brevundimonas TaxID=2622653 RepID=UPI000CFCB482|nr:MULTISPECIES: L-threonylcarbamoyladenylate synthase [unclassified Brevundimonas]PRA33537.1 threonylcarbamoyl-AMP synthase [Brevundimonas sp. MYb27]PQZ81753.1 threonylcarbamoyl-AMP synthase [Brevundimonas sp. MYb31]PRB13396.1 threonylcarbamoyl-AMP synthase [Brevundimonas sp. MYb52]PRB34045.1 threonylcarbamoyl-AMP synthase [Brevundimonas sp. MYb46]PRB52733.1 threonylcarbamoyl-AMP synthase [Brevundimonas sp. MYb33]